MNPEQWLSLKWNGGSTMSDRWLNQSKIIHYLLITKMSISKIPINTYYLYLDSSYPLFSLNTHQLHNKLITIQMNTLALIQNNPDSLLSEQL